MVKVSNEDYELRTAREKIQELKAELGTLRQAYDNKELEMKKLKERNEQLNGDLETLYQLCKKKDNDTKHIKERLALLERKNSQYENSSTRTNVNSNKIEFHKQIHDQLKKSDLVIDCFIQVQEETSLIKQKNIGKNLLDELLELSNRQEKEENQRIESNSPEKKLNGVSNEMSDGSKRKSVSFAENLVKCRLFGKGIHSYEDHSMLKRQKLIEKNPFLDHENRPVGILNVNQINSNKKHSLGNFENLNETKTKNSYWDLENRPILSNNQKFGPPKSSKPILKTTTKVVYESHEDTFTTKKRTQEYHLNAFDNAFSLIQKEFQYKSSKTKDILSSSLLSLTSNKIYSVSEDLGKSDETANIDGENVIFNKINPIKKSSSRKKNADLGSNDVIQNDFQKIQDPGFLIKKMKLSQKPSNKIEAGSSKQSDRKLEKIKDGQTTEKNQSIFINENKNQFVTLVKPVKRAKKSSKKNFQDDLSPSKAKKILTLESNEAPVSNENEHQSEVLLKAKRPKKSSRNDLSPSPGKKTKSSKKNKNIKSKNTDSSSEQIESARDENSLKKTETNFSLSSNSNIFETKDKEKLKEDETKNGLNSNQQKATDETALANQCNNCNREFKSLRGLVVHKRTCNK